MVVTAKLCLLLLCSLFLFFVGSAESAAGEPSKHMEVHRAKSEIDSLLLKLYLKINTTKAKAALAEEMKEQSDKLIEIAEKEVSILKYVQHLLHQFSKGLLDHNALKNCSVFHISGRKELGQKDSPANSCKQIHDASLQGGKPQAKNGIYWIKTDMQGENVLQTYCDMVNGGWTLIGKINGRVGNIFNTWLITEHNSAALKSPKISSETQYACLDARTLAVEYASAVLFSSGESAQGLGSKWVQWPLPANRERETFWKHGTGQTVVNAAPKVPVTVTDQDKNTKTCYQNKYGIMPLQQHGGSYPYASFNPNGNTNTGDLCMGVGVVSTGSNVNSWSQNGNGYDSPQSDSDWPNGSYNHQRPRLSVWVK